MNARGPDLLAALSDLLGRLPNDAPLLDQESHFPSVVLDALRETGALRAPLPRALGGAGLGTEAAAGSETCELLIAFGRAWMPLGRVFEGHVNALRLIVRYGTPAQAETAARDARDGHLFAIWSAERPDAPVRIEDGQLYGSKSFASGAGAVSRALVTARAPNGGEIMVVAPVEAARIGAKPQILGMRGAGTAAVDLSGIPAPATAFIGQPGDYMRQPEISLGAWRTLAVLAGGVSALVDALAHDLLARGRGDHPHQRSRFGACLVASETARLWVTQAALAAEADTAGEDAATYVKLAREAVDAACGNAIQRVQRSAGLAGFAGPHPIERLCRDLSTYMRQPALDETLDEAAVHILSKNTKLPTRSRLG